MALFQVMIISIIIRNYYLEWNDIYLQILDQYQSNGGLCGVRLAAKNIEDHIVSGRADLSKSVISSRVSAYKACEHTFRNYSTTVLQVPSRKWDIPGPRLLVAGSYDRNIGWAHFDPQKKQFSKPGRRFKTLSRCLRPRRTQ